MIDSSDERLPLTISLADAVRFAIGASDLHYTEPSDEIRQLVGLLALDMLEYSEQWRMAGLLRASMQATWPNLFQ